MKLQEIASRIDAHLKAFEASPKINATKEQNRIRPYYQAGAHEAGRFVGVCYVRFQGTHSLSKADAEVYLQWLDAGNVGRHYEALKDIFAQRQAAADAVRDEHARARAAELRTILKNQQAVRERTERIATAQRRVIEAAKAWFHAPLEKDAGTADDLVLRVAALEEAERAG